VLACPSSVITLSGMRNFIPTQAAGLAALEHFVNGGNAGAKYERNRNTDFGPAPSAANAYAVSHLSPYIRHRMLTETQVLKTTLTRETPEAAEKFIQEVCWRTYWKGWLEHRPEVWQRYTEERDNASAMNPATAKAISQAARGATGIQCFDAWADELVSTGYLHNHTRMWFASIWIFTLNLPWASGADFFMQHLCDADAASNTLSWRWVAGLHTVGKHYLARADNIARYTNQRFNPRGQLNESAQPKTESNTAKRSLNPATNQQENFQSKPISSATVRTQSIDSRSWLLVHDEDLSPDDWLLQEQLAGVIVLNSANTRSTNGVGEVSAAFNQGALNDVTKRLQKRWQLKDQQIIHCGSPAHLAKQLEGHQVFAKAPIVHAWIPVGPTRDALTAPIKQLRSQGATFQSVLSEWDQLAWPHATKGFFQFRTRIPELLHEIGDATGRLV
jgi:deoxyribodipyrimidine photo-lyase